MSNNNTVTTSSGNINDTPSATTLTSTTFTTARYNPDTDPQGDSEIDQNEDLIDWGKHYSANQLNQVDIF